ncbi:MAG: HAD family phosphatase [Cryomorphaceae bacterium]|jgi:putative hydrolase of the HAD superfamily|nr:HAD family phosphatase [Cryomorphaceae bacterium]
MKYDAVIFDLGGVLINLDYSCTTKAFEALGMNDFSSKYSQLSQTDLFSDFETGKISAQQFINSLLPHLPEGTSANSVVQAWNKMILDVPRKRIELLLRLKEKLPVFLLSNTNELHVPVVRREWAKTTSHPMEYFFNRIYFSHELKMRKPHPEIFSEVCARESLVPENTLFIDDTIIHVEGAQQAGLQTHHLKHADELDQLFS